MKTPAVLLLGAVALFAAAPLSAQPAPRNETTPVLQAAPAVPAQPLPANRPRLLSAETTSKLAIAQRQFVPKPEVTETAPAPASDLREVDKPRNGIIRLPQHTVQGRRIPVLKERDILTPHGKLNLALKRYPGLRLRIPFLPFLSNNGVAMAMIEDDFRLERIAEMNYLTELMQIGGNQDGANSLKKDAARGFLRSSEWINYGGSHGEWRASGRR